MTNRSVNVRYTKTSFPYLGVRFFVVYCIDLLIFVGQIIGHLGQNQAYLLDTLDKRGKIHIFFTLRIVFFIPLHSEIDG